MRLMTSALDLLAVHFKQPDSTNLSSLFVDLHKNNDAVYRCSTKDGEAFVC